MNTLLRWGKFNLVGAMGMGLQLTALALFNRWMAGRYLYASAAALELTLLHNFMWHLHYTWRDRRDDSTRLRQFVRFHLSNGLAAAGAPHGPGAASRQGFRASLERYRDFLLLGGELLHRKQLGVCHVPCRFVALR
jgi:GtrA-like protein